MEEVIIGNRCRLCLSPDGPMLPIVYSDPQNVTSFVSVSMPSTEKINLITSVRVTRQAVLPNIICQKCDEYMNNFLNFKQRCVSTNNDLQKYCALLQINTNSAIKYIKAIFKESPKPNYKDSTFLIKCESNSAMLQTEAPVSHISDDRDRSNTPTVGREDSLLQKTMLIHPEEIIVPLNFKEMFINENNLDGVKEEIDERCESDDPLTCMNDDVDLSERSSDFEERSILDANAGKGSSVLRQGKPVRHIECSVCTEEFNNVKSLYRHERTTLHNRKCHLCTDFSSKSRRDCLLHIKMCHTVTSCPVCGKIYKSQNDHLKHSKRCPNLNSFLCNICAQSFDNQRQLTIHLRLHEYSEFRGMTKFCNFCEYSTTSTRSILAHLLNNHKISTYERNYECDSCDSTFGTKDSLLSHIQRCHIKEKFTCKLCDSELQTFRSLRTHVNNYHSNREKTQKCTICSKMFLRLEGLTRHMRVHTGETPFSCSFCDRAFTMKQNLDAHLRLHTGDKPYKCEVCGLAFRHNVSKKNHMKYHKDVPGFVYTPPVNNRKYVKKKKNNEVDVASEDRPLSSLQVNN